MNHPPAGARGVQTDAEPLEAGLEIRHLGDQPDGFLAREGGVRTGRQHGQAAPHHLELVLPVHARATLGEHAFVSPAKLSRLAEVASRLEMAQPVWDVALSFAGEERDYVKEVAGVLRTSDVTYFFDEERRVDLWGHNLLDELDATYRLNARFVVMFVSAAYAAKAWPNLERQSAQSRALEQTEPYILPVRFDDTDLPGLPPTIRYEDARTTPAQEIGEMIVAKVTNSRDADAAEDRGEGWEYLLWIDELETSLAGYDREWRDFEVGYARPAGRPLSIEEVGADLELRWASLRRIVSNIQRLFDPAILTPAFGVPGESGDADRICHLAAAVVDVYASILRWAADVRGALVPEEAEPVYQIVPDFVAQPLRQIRDYVDETNRTLRPLIESMRAGTLPDEPRTIELALTLTLPDDVNARFAAALDELLRVAQARPRH